MHKPYYERYWESQDVLDDFSYKWPILQKLLPEDKKLKFFDFGCGTGVILQHIAKIRPHYQLCGVDISSKALSLTKRRIARATLKHISENQVIPFRTNAFDVVLASDVLEHIYDTEVAFGELARVLKPGGQLIITVPFNSTLKVIVASLIAFDEYFHPYSPHIRFFSKSSLLWCLKEAGLLPLRTGYYGRFYPLSKGMYIVATK